MRVTQPEAPELTGRGPRMDMDSLRKMAGIEFRAEEAAAKSSEDASKNQDGKRVERLVNGDTGFIIGWSMDTDNRKIGMPKWVGLQLDDGRRVWINGEDVGVLDHAYALTVHAVQGSECKNVLVCVTDGGRQFMNANMLLTAFSRAKEKLYVWGEEKVLKKVAATPLPERNSALPQKVAAAFAAMNAEGLADAESVGVDQDDVKELESVYECQ